MFVDTRLRPMLDIEVIDDPAAAVAVLDPLRRRILGALAEPGSATSVADALGEPRQKVNYHLRTLEDRGLVELVEERPRRGLKERVMRATARSYIVSPSVLDDRAADPDRTDRLSARYLVALGARMVREVADLVRRADRMGKSVPTLSIDTEIRFDSAGARAEFTRDLGAVVGALASRYHTESAADGRRHRLVLASYPCPPTNRKAQR